MSCPQSSRRRTLAVAVAALYSATLLSPVVSASERRLAGSVLEMHHRNRTFVDPTNESTASITEQPVYVLRKGDTVSIVVVDRNPLLFTYDAELTAAETEQHKIAAQFAKSLSDLVETFRSRLGAGQEDVRVVEGLNLANFREAFTSLNNRILALPAKIDQSIGAAADVEAMKGEVAGWQVSVLANSIREGYKKAAIIAGKCLSGQPLQTDQGLVSCNDKFAPRKTAAFHVIDGAALPEVTMCGPSESDDLIEQQPPPVSNQNPPKPTGVVEAKPVEQPAPNPNPVGSGSPSPSGDSIQSFIVLALAMQSRIEASLNVVTGFAADVAEINTPKTLRPSKDKDHYEYSIQDQTVTIVVEPSSKYDEFLSPSAKKARQNGVGKFPLMLKPYTPATISVAPAFVLLFGTDPKFKAVKAGDQFEIQKEDPQGVGYNIAAMLTITPKAWSEPTFGGQFQIGVSPTKDNIGFYLGAGINVQELFTFGLGAAYHQVNRLASGLSVGQKISSADALKTEKEYRPAFYFHITTNLKK